MSLDPVRLLRAFIFAMPLAVLVGSVLAPPDAFATVVVIVAALLAGWPLAYRLVAVRDISPRAIAAFYVVVLAVVVAGLWGVSKVGVTDPGVAAGARVLVVGMALIVAELVVFERPG